MLKIELNFLSLTLLELGILFVNYVQASLPPDDLAVGTALFNRCSNFHSIQSFNLLNPLTNHQALRTEH
jgi:hypothetical protein